jgi:hypothetical protein
LAAGDFDGDGDIDLATANRDGVALSTLRGVGDGTFATGMEATTNCFARAIVAADVNGDGATDLVVANHFVAFPTGSSLGHDSVAVFLGDGKGAT